MIIDSSAILAVIGKEPGYERIVHQLAASPETRIGAPTRLETGIVLTARFGPRGKTALARFLQENSIQTVAFDEAHASAARTGAKRAQNQAQKIDTTTKSAVLVMRAASEGTRPATKSPGNRRESNGSVAKTRITESR